MLQRGQFGDSFGAISSLFSALAFAGVLFTIWLQRRDLAQTREEVEAQRERLDEQVAISRQQTFENSFFHLLTLRAQLLADMRLGNYQGNELVREMYRQLQNTYGAVLRSNAAPDRKVAGLMAYMNFYNEYQAWCGHYFRTLYNIFKFIATSDIQNKKFYSNLVRAQLSRDELGLLFYNCASQMGHDKFKPLVEEFGILKQLDERVLLDPDHKQFYQKSAFC